MNTPTPAYNTSTPAYLAKFVHRVPFGATIPAGTEHAFKAGDSFGLETMTYDYEQTPGALDRWTAEPLLTPEHARLEAEYAEACQKIAEASSAIATAERARGAATAAAQRLYGALLREGLR